MHPYFRMAVAVAGLVSFSSFGFGLTGLIDPELLGWPSKTGILTKFILVACLFLPLVLFRPVLRQYQTAIRLGHTR